MSQADQPAPDAAWGQRNVTDARTFVAKVIPTAPTDTGNRTSVPNAAGHEYDRRNDDARRSDPQGDGSAPGVQPRVDRGEFLGTVEAQSGGSSGTLEVAPASPAAYLRGFAYWLVTGGHGELSVWLRVSWKVLVWSMVAMLCYVLAQPAEIALRVFIGFLAAGFLFFAVFARLGWD